MDGEANPKLHEPLDDEERKLTDPDTWDWDAAQVLEPTSGTSAALAIRLTRDELTRVEQAARVEGVTLTQFMKKSALLRALERARA